MQIKRSLFILILSFLLCQPQANARRRLLTNEEGAALILAIALILDSDNSSAMVPEMLEPMPVVPFLDDIDTPIDLLIDGSTVSILLPNLVDGRLLSCTTIPALPAGLSTRIVRPAGIPDDVPINGPGRNACEIFGVATTPSVQTTYRVVVGNNQGSSSAVVTLSVSN